MSQGQFVTLLATMVVLLTVVPVVTVEIAIRVRWRHIEGMFDRALAHGGSLDTLSRSLREDSRATKEMAAGALDASRILKGQVDDHDTRLRRLEEHPLLRPLGGPARPHQ